MRPPRRCSTRASRRSSSTAARCCGCSGPRAPGLSTVAVEVVAQRVERGEATADGCLLLAPTRLAAARLRDAVTARLGGTTTTPLARTHQSLGFGILREAAALVGDPTPRLLSGPEQDVILGELLAGHAAGESAAPPWPESVHLALPTRTFRGELRDLLMRAVELGLDPEDLARLGRAHDRPEWVAAAHVLLEYDEVTALSAPGAFDPAWILGAAADHLEADPEALDRLRAGLRLVVVDDAQELTPAALRLLQVVVGRGGVDLVLLGDPDAATQTFRGADPRLFVTAWPDAPTRLLSTSYRCGGAVLRRRHPGGGPRRGRGWGRPPPGGRRRRTAASVEAHLLRTAAQEAELRRRAAARGAPARRRARGRGWPSSCAAAAARPPCAGCCAVPGCRSTPPPPTCRCATRRRCARSSPSCAAPSTSSPVPSSSTRPTSSTCSPHRSVVRMPSCCAGCGGRCGASSSTTAGAAPATCCSPRRCSTPSRSTAIGPEAAPARRAHRVLAAAVDALRDGDGVEVVLWRMWSASGLAGPWRDAALGGGPGRRPRRPRPRRRAGPVRRRRALRRPAARAPRPPTSSTTCSARTSPATPSSRARPRGSRSRW